MKEMLEKKLKELQERRAKHAQNFQQLSSARENASVVLNATLGAIEVVEQLIKEVGIEKK